MKCFLTALVAAVALVLFASAGARADSIPPSQVTFSYSFGLPGAQSNNVYTAYSDQGQGAGVTFTPERPNTAQGTPVNPSQPNGPASTLVLVTDLQAFSNTPNATNSQNTLVNNGAYTVNMTLGIPGTSQQGTLTFTGALGGAFSTQNSSITNTWNNPVQTLTLNGYDFQVALNSFTAPGNSNDSGVGSMNAWVTVTTAGSSGPTPASTPEPSTMLLSAFGLTFLGGAAWRKRRQAGVTVPA